MADDHAVAHSAERPVRAPLIPPERYPFYDKLLFAILVLVVPVFVASNWFIYRDGDVSWHLAAGRWILENGRIPSTDPFSFTMAGKPWVAFEWGSEIILWTAYRLAGFAGLGATVAAAMMALLTILFAYLRPKAGPVALLVVLVATYVVLMPFIIARPHTLAWPFLAGWSALMFHYRDQGRAPPLALAGLMFVWANIHGSYFAGFLVAASAALDALNDAGWERKALLRWLAFGVLSLLVTLLNANGLAGFLHPVSISSMETLQGIAEWRPSTTRNTPGFFAALIAVIAGLLWRRPRFRVGELSLLLLLLAMAFTHVRHQSVFVILAAMIVTPKLAHPAREQAAPLFTSRASARGWIAATVLVAVVILGTRAMIPLVPRETLSNPRSLIAHVPADLRSEPVLNEYAIGGPLILAGIRPFIDGRADMYGDAFFGDYLKIIDGDMPLFNRVVQKYGIRWTILQDGNRLIPLLDASPEWRRLYSDSVGVIHVRRTDSGKVSPSCGEDEKREDCR
jgi:hypothetical protein